MYRSKHLSKSSSRLITSRCWHSSAHGKNVTKKTSTPKHFVRGNSTSSANLSGSTGAYLGASVATVGLLGVGATVYAKYDDEFRKNIEKNLPFTKEMFTSLYGEAKKKRNLLPEEKDLTIPFETPVEKEALMEDSLSLPLFGDNIKQQPSEADVLALNTLDTPGFSAIDLELSNRVKTSQIDESNDSQSVPLFVDNMKPKSSDGDFLALNTLDTPGISAMDIDLSDRSKNSELEKTDDSNLGDLLCDHDHQAKTESVDIVANENSLTSEEQVTVEGSEESFVVIKSKHIPAVQDEDNTSDRQSVDSNSAKVTEDNALPLEGPLTPEEIQLLSQVVDTSALEVILGATTDHLKVISDVANQTHQKAADSIRAYVKQISETLFLSKDDDNYEHIWSIISEYEKASQEIMDQAKVKSIEVKEEMLGLKELMDSIRKTGHSAILDKTHELLESCENDLSAAENEIAKAERELVFFLFFQEYTRAAPATLQENLKSFTPDFLKLLTLNHDELKDLSLSDALLALSLKRSEVQSSDINEEKITASEKFQELLEKQRIEITTSTEEKLANELHRIEKEKNVEQELKLHKVEETYEKEMLAQLKRQASAHNAHLNDVLESKSQELDTRHKGELKEKLTEQQKAYEFNLQKNVAAVQGIHSKITDVVDIAQHQRRVQELWIASQALNAAIEEGLFHGRTRTLMPEMLSVIHLGGGNKVLQEIVESVPEAAAMFGVVPEKDLLQRFKHVKSVCKKVALIDEQGGSIGTYLISYVKSLFVYSGWYQRNIENSIDIDNLGPYEILSKAEYFIQEGDLEQAAKFMSQLKGAARKISSDWLNEVRLLLETKQTAQLLQAYAAALNAGAD